MSVVLRRVMVLIMEGRITRRPVHHASRLSVHHVTHRRIRAVRPARTCGQWWKHYTLLRLDLCSVIGRRVLDKLAATPFEVLEELENSTTTRYSVLPRREEAGDEGDREESHVEGQRRACVMRFAEVTTAPPITSKAYVYLVYVKKTKSLF